MAYERRPRDFDGQDGRDGEPVFRGRGKRKLFYTFSNEPAQLTCFRRNN
jgi:hypothetical protein